MRETNNQTHTSAEALPSSLKVSRYSSSTGLTSVSRKSSGYISKSINSRAEDERIVQVSPTHREQALRSNRMHTELGTQLTQHF
jgi:hypothetical protein